MTYCQTFIKHLYAKETKKLSKQIVTKQQWEDLKPIIMGEILKMKFIQCEEFRQTLIYARLHQAQCQR
jgi:predicted NAD-dependent protein-ADP-ribosyltransferase YbiA (DUF1768 family)